MTGSKKKVQISEENGIVPPWQAVSNALLPEERLLGMPAKGLVLNMTHALALQCI